MMRGAQTSYIADIATASWYARRATTSTSPKLTRSPPIRHESSSGETSESESDVSIPVTVKRESAVLAMSPSPELEVESGSEGDPTHKIEDGDRSSNTGIRSDITAWQSALQSLPAEFANTELSSNPLVQALVGQPTLRRVEWNPYRLNGGFVPRTYVDFCSLMIYVSGQINPDPCRNCLLKNGPFAKCVIAPTSVLAIGKVNHACANCTYQNQYKRCTHDPITETERARSKSTRNAMRPMHATSKIVRAPMISGRTRRKLETRQQVVEKTLVQSKPQEQQQILEVQQQHEVKVTQPPAVMEPSIREGPFDEKLRKIRASSPRSRRRLAAEVLQWQAAIATVEAEEIQQSSPNTSILHQKATLPHGEPSSSYSRTSLSDTIPFKFASSSSNGLVDTHLAKRDSSGLDGVNAGTGTSTGTGAGYPYEPMEEDEWEP
ncbi:hypothetical protein GGR50DRAFT_576392 [Xylaria sp. CBS 124048]|nr:hypothetical protein GGR50DRAFT_576392 [Xylaria sp. CBS 124048]